jgi:hypothetical protein
MRDLTVEKLNIGEDHIEVDKIDSTRAEKKKVHYDRVNLNRKKN